MGLTFWGEETYSISSVKKFIAESRFDGLILGDLFCCKRMFAGGIAEMIQCIAALLDSDKKLVYQTPLYVTARNWEEQRSIIAMILAKKPDSLFLVQDIGVLQMIRQMSPSAEIIWSIMGRDRENRWSADTLAYLQSLGLTGFEVEGEERFPLLQRARIKPYLCQGGMRYKTLGRECYYKYQLGVCDPEGCRSGAYRLEADETPYEMTIDGYVLGKSRHTLSEEKLAHIEMLCQPDLLVYAETERGNP